jgi:Domain of unknown function (DUF4262)
VGMCEICNGATYQQVLEKMRGPIAGGRWSLQGVEGGAHGSSWVYTVGLIHNFHHPELVAVDAELMSVGGLLNELGDRVSRGLRIDTNTTVDLDGYVVEFEAVHDSYLGGGLCVHWDNYNAWVGAHPGPIQVLQVVPPLSEWCEDCDRRRRCLATPGARGFGDHRNRAARRAQSRRRRS